MELFKESNSFSSLCEDYYECKAALDKLNCSKKREEIMRKEYEVILQEIEDELITNILLSRSKE